MTKEECSRSPMRAGPFNSTRRMRTRSRMLIFSTFTAVRRVKEKLPPGPKLTSVSTAVSCSRSTGKSAPSFPKPRGHSIADVGIHRAPLKRGGVDPNARSEHEKLPTKSGLVDQFSFRLISMRPASHLWKAGDREQSRNTLPPRALNHMQLSRSIRQKAAGVIVGSSVGLVPARAAAFTLLMSKTHRTFSSDDDDDNDEKDEEEEEEEEEEEGGIVNSSVLVATTILSSSLRRSKHPSSKCLGRGSGARSRQIRRVVTGCCCCGGGGGGGGDDGGLFFANDGVLLLFVELGSGPPPITTTTTTTQNTVDMACASTAGGRRTARRRQGVGRSLIRVAKEDQHLAEVACIESFSNGSLRWRGMARGARVVKPFSASAVARPPRPA